RRRPAVRIRCTHCQRPQSTYCGGMSPHPSKPWSVFLRACELRFQPIEPQVNLNHHSVGTTAFTTVPFLLKVTSRLPPSCARRSFIPRIPTPNAFVWPVCESTDERPLPLSLICKETCCAFRFSSIAAFLAPECRCTLLRDS